MDIVEAALTGVILTLAAAIALLIREIRHMRRRQDIQAHAIELLAIQHPALQVPEEPERPPLRLVRGDLAAFTALSVAIGTLARRAPRTVRAGAALTAATGAVAALLIGLPARTTTDSGNTPSGPLMPMGSITTPLPIPTSATAAAPSSARPTAPVGTTTAAAPPVSAVPILTVTTTTTTAPIGTPTPTTGSPTPTGTTPPLSTTAVPSPSCLIEATVTGVLDICIG